MSTIITKITDWWSQIDWSATGSMIGAIGTCIAAGIAVKIAIKQNEITKQIADEQNRIEKEIAEKQLKQAELEIKISLYEKRYICFQLLQKYLYIGGILKHKQKKIPPEIQQQIIESVYYTNEADRESLTNEIRSLYGYLSDSQNTAMAWMKEAAGVSSSIATEYEENKKKIAIVDKKLLNLDFEYSERQINTIKTARFCFPNEIAEPIIKYISLIFSWDAYEKKCLNEEAIINSYEDICSKMIIPKIEDLLKLSYNELGGYEK